MCCQQLTVLVVVVALITCAYAASSANDIQPTEVKLKHCSRSVHLRFPHAVLFGRICGGTIISPNWVLTAAQCALYMTDPYVLAGTSNSRDGTGVTRKVKRFVIYPLFDVGPYWLDPKVFNIKQGFMSNEMHAMDLTVQSNQVCSMLAEFLSEDMLCAKGRPPRYDSACSGDSGSGLVDETGCLVGVVSWAENDAIECKKGNLVVFSRVSSIRNWIKQVTKI